MKLTKRLIDSFVYQGNNGKRDVRWDATLPGFGLRIYPNNKKAFVLSYRVNGRKRLMTLGNYGVLALDQARDIARQHYVDVIKGNDPLEDRKKAAKGETVKDLCVAYLEQHAKVHKKSWKEDERRIERHLLPIWGNLKVSNIKRADVSALHGKIGKHHPYEANRVLELISKMFSLARRWGFVDENAANPASDIDRFKEKKRDRWVKPDELPHLIKAIDQEKNLYAQAALWLYLLTGVRRSELLHARWEDIDWERRELQLPETKAGRVHYVPLSEAALSLLRRLPKVDGNPYLLPGHKQGKHLVNIDKPWQRVRDRATVKFWAAHSDKQVSGFVAGLIAKLGQEPTRAEVEAAADFDLPPGIGDVRLHDLRRTVGSWLAQAGNSLHLIGKVLNHSSPNTTAIYARFAQDQVRQALEDHGKRILGVAGQHSGAEIVSLRR
jgi:integrase